MLHFRFREKSFLLLAVLGFLREESCQNLQVGINDTVFDIISEILSGRFDSITKSCIIEELKSNRIIDRFYKPELLTDQKTLEKELEPYLPDAESSCSSSEGLKKEFFIGTPLGIGILVTIILSTIIAVFVGWTLVKKYRGQERVPSYENA